VDRVGNARKHYRAACDATFSRRNLGRVHARAKHSASRNGVACKFNINEAGREKNEEEKQEAAK
jgi:hypothetical protein